LKSTFRGGWSWVEAARNETELLESMQNTISACDSCAAATTSTWNHMLSLVEGYHLPDLVYLCLLFISVLAMSSIVIGSEISVAFKFRSSLSLLLTTGFPYFIHCYFLVLLMKAMKMEAMIMSLSWIIIIKKMGWTVMENIVSVRFQLSWSRWSNFFINGRRLRQCYWCGQWEEVTLLLMS
jgi:hypothetical protein